MSWFLNEISSKRWQKIYQEISYRFPVIDMHARIVYEKIQQSSILCFTRLVIPAHWNVWTISQVSTGDIITTLGYVSVSSICFIFLCATNSASLCVMSCWKQSRISIKSCFSIVLSFVYEQYLMFKLSNSKKKTFVLVILPASLFR